MQTVFDLSQGSGYFDLCPVAFLILELVQDEKGQPEDLIIRYGNPALAKIAKRPASELQGKRLFQDLIPEEPKDKWMPTYVAAALSGEDKEVHEFIGVTNRYWKVTLGRKKGFVLVSLQMKQTKFAFKNTLSTWQIMILPPVRTAKTALKSCASPIIPTVLWAWYM